MNNCLYTLLHFNSGFFVKRIATAPLLFFTLLFACDNSDDPGADKTGPEIIIKGVEENAIVWDVVDIMVEASDRSGVESITISIDGTPVKTVNQTPYNLTWDTNPLADSIHTIKVTASDKAGNTSEREVMVSVRNTLVTFTALPDHLFNTGGWVGSGLVFLSDENGKLIASAPFTNGETVAINAHSFKGATFYLTQADVETYAGNTYIHLITFAGVERGDWVLHTETAENQAYAGAAQINFTNPKAVSLYTAASNGGDYAWPADGNLSANIQLTKSPSKLYVTRFSQDGTAAPVYHLYSDIVTGENTIDLTAVTNPLTKLTPSIPATMQHAQVDLIGALTAGDFSEKYNLGYFYEIYPDDQFVTLYKPGNAFASYYVHLYSETPEYAFSRGTGNIDQLDFTPLTYEGGVTYSDRAITSSITGNIDFVSTAYETDDANSKWTFIFAAGENIVIPIPELPDTLKAFDLPVIDNAPGHFTVYDFENISSYQELKMYINNSTYGMEELYLPGGEYAELRVLISPSNARKHNRRLTKSDITLTGKSSHANALRH